MNIQMLPLDAVTPHAENPRKNNDAVTAVARSIQEFGFNQPIVVDENNVIIVGRWKAGG